MATNNAINNSLASPFSVGGTSVTSTGTQLNYLNALTAVPINKIAIQSFTGNGTYTPTSGMVYCIVEIVGGGGGGGGIAAGTVGQSAIGGVGAGGGYCRKLYTAANIGANAAVTIGAGGAGGASGGGAPGSTGGTSTFDPAGTGVTLSAGGGGGGSGMAESASAQVAFGGSPGAVSGGDLNIVADYGAVASTAAAGTLASSVGGGKSYLSADTYPIYQLGSGGGTGGAAGGYGCGSNGRYSVGAGGSTGAGEAGSDGVCIVTEFISA